MSGVIDQHDKGYNRCSSPLLAQVTKDDFQPFLRHGQTASRVCQRKNKTDDDREKINENKSRNQENK